MLKHFNLNHLLTSSTLSSVHISNCRWLCVKPKTNRGSRKILDHFENSGQITNLDLFPTDLKRVTSKKNQQIYVADKLAGEEIANSIGRFYVKNVPFVELSPGPCILSKALLRQLDVQTLVLIANDGEFADTQQVIYI